MPGQTHNVSKYQAAHRDRKLFSFLASSLKAAAACMFSLIDWSL